MNLLTAKVIKMSGAGNTFVLVDARPGSLWNEFENKNSLKRAEVARRLCDEVVGLKCDGVVFIENGSSGVDYNWDFYNSDGSGAEMCGNAARCAARFCQIYISESPKDLIRFQTGAGLVSAELLPSGKIRVSMPEAHWVKKNISLKLKSGETQEFAMVNTGVPHLVREINNLSQKESLKEMARECRWHADIQPQGANVTFYVPTSSQDKVEAVTFERGVENYTLACGTGAVAVAMVVAEKENLSEVRVEMPGGGMDIRFEKQNPRPYMTGDAIVIGEFYYNTEVFR